MRVAWFLWSASKDEYYSHITQQPEAIEKGEKPWGHQLYASGITVQSFSSILVMSVNNLSHFVWFFPPVLKYYHDWFWQCRSVFGIQNVRQIHQIKYMISNKDINKNTSLLHNWKICIAINLTLNDSNYTSICWNYYHRNRKKN